MALAAARRAAATAPRHARCLAAHEGGWRSRPPPRDTDAGGRRQNTFVDRRGGSGGGPSASAGAPIREGAVTLYGVNPVAAALTSSKRDLYTLYVQADGDGVGPRGPAAAGAARRAAVAAAAAAAGVTVIQTDKHALNLATRDAPHQGIVLEASPLEWGRLPPWPRAADAAASGFGGPDPSAHPVWLVLDEVADPHNLGAIARSALFLGAAGVALAPKNCAPASPAASKASAGALELLRICAVAGPLAASLTQAAAAGWGVVAAAAGEGAEPVRGFRVDKPTLLVLGSEGTGLRPLVARACGRRVAVSGGGGPAGGGPVDSLNVSVAAGVLLHELLASAAGR